MVLRKVSEIKDTWEFPFSVIEQQEDGIIIEFEEYYSIQIQATDDEGNLLFETVDEEQIPIMTTEQVKVDLRSVPGSNVTWNEVNNVLYFDFVIGDNVYSWSNKTGTTKVGVDIDNSIGVVSYKKMKMNDSIAKIRRVISPKFTPLKLINGNITIDGVCFANKTFIDAKTNKVRTMSEIKLIRDGIEKELNYDVIEEFEMV